MTRVAALVLVAAFAIAPAAQGQGGVIPRRGNAADSARAARDTTKKDSLALAPPDSVERALMARRGFLSTRYQGDSVSFNAKDNNLLLYGKPALVLRDAMRVAGDTVSFDDIKKILIVGGTLARPARVKDPSQPNEIVAYNGITYWIDDKHGTAGTVKTAANSGSIWYVGAERGGFVADSGGGASYGRNATMTTDADSVPQYYFKVGEYKQVGGHYMVARPAILHIGEVPVLWIPWLFQDMRRGRHGGILTPQFGVADIVRNSPTYRRTVDNLGVYVAPSDFWDAEFAVDWRSGARPTIGDPGWVTVRSDIRYAWLDRFISGDIGIKKQSLDDGTSNLTLSLVHVQHFSRQTQLNVSLNYMTSTTIEQQTAINPAAVVGTIQSSANYSTQFGPVSAALGFGQRQYPGRAEIDRDFPTLNLTTKPIAATPWLTWSPSFTTSVHDGLHIDSPSEFAYHYITDANGALDSLKSDRNTRTSALSFGTPFKVGNFSIAANLRLSDLENDFPEAKVVIDPADTSIHRVITYKRTYLTTLDWDLGMSLPQISQGKWNVVPSITLQNVDPGGYLVRSERTGTEFVSQSKRLVYGVSLSPTLYHLTGGIGPFAALRSSITPSFNYGYSPTASVSDAYLGALGRTRQGYLGAIAQNRVSLGFSTVLEGKFRPRPDSVPPPLTPTGPGAAPPAGPVDPGKKMRLLSLQFTALEYDFERARVTHHSGFSSETFGYTVRSDLLPGLDFGEDYSLFDAPSISDSAHFKPYLTAVHASLSLGSGTGAPGPLARLVHWMTGEQPPPKDTGRTGTVGVQPGTPTNPAPPSLPGMAARSNSTLTDIPTGKGWQASLTFVLNRQRPPHGNNVVAINTLDVCNQFLQTNPAQYDICIRQQAPLNTDNSQTQTTGGGVVYQFPAQASIQGNVTFNLTHDWAAQWTTSYDVVRGAFASQILNLQRDIHDWRAIFGFSEAANGNFQFHFLISLRPAPDLKLPFDRTSIAPPR